MDVQRTPEGLDRRKTMKADLSLIVVLGILLTGLSQTFAAAGKFDGSAPMICGTTAVAECVANGRCQRSSAVEINFPALFRVDAAAKKLRNLQADTGQQGTESSIRNVDHANGKMILSGAEGERGWSVLIHESTGMMSAAVAGDGEGFVIFGHCTLQ